MAPSTHLRASRLVLVAGLALAVGLTASCSRDDAAPSSSPQSASNGSLRAPDGTAGANGSGTSPGQRDVTGSSLLAPGAGGGATGPAAAPGATSSVPPAAAGGPGPTGPTPTPAPGPGDPGVSGGPNPSPSPSAPSPPSPTPPTSLYNGPYPVQSCWQYSGPANPDGSPNVVYYDDATGAVVAYIAPDGSMVPPQGADLCANVHQ